MTCNSCGNNRLELRGDGNTYKPWFVAVCGICFRWLTLLDVLAGEID